MRGPFDSGKRIIFIPALLSALLLLVIGCSGNSKTIPVYSYEIVDSWPHDPEAFTQGLVFHHGFLFESTGLRGQSTLRKVDLESGKILKERPLAAHYFAEGLAALNGKLFQLTWRGNTGFVYDIHTFELKDRFTYRGEGWGLTSDGLSLIMSDGTNRIRFLDPDTFELERTIEVHGPGNPPVKLNELEFVEGEIYANLYPTDRVARIDPKTGDLLGYIDFSDLMPFRHGGQSAGVLNGIAYDAKNDRLFVTGKRWPRLFEVRLKQTQK